MKEMHHITLKDAGSGKQVLALATMPMPSPGPGEVLIQVAAAGVNRPDLLQRRGHYPPPPGASPILGLEVSGTICAVGAGLNPSLIGEKVCALLTGGGYADYCVAPYGQCLPIPKNLSFVEAASLPEAYFTVWSTIFERGRLQPGETILVHGGASGIGVAAVQLASALGHSVFVTAGSERKCKACLELGAAHAINYREEDFVERINQLSQGQGVNVILDMVGGDYVPRNLQVLSDEGRLVLIAFMGGAKSSLNIPDILFRRLTVTGFTLRARPVTYKKEIAEKLLHYVWPLFERKRIKPVIYKTFPLEEAETAHQLLESGECIGKLVLVVKDHLNE